LIKPLKNILLNIFLRLIDNINQKNFSMLLFLFFLRRMIIALHTIITVIKIFDCIT